jgi:hypothetical protein
MIEIEPDDIPEMTGHACMTNAHGLNPVSVQALAKSMGARLKILLVGCESLVADRDESGDVGLSDVVEAAATRNIEAVRPGMEIIAVSSKTGAGMDHWVERVTLSRAILSRGGYSISGEAPI